MSLCLIGGLEQIHFAMLLEKVITVFGATLNSGNSLNWLCNKVLGEENQFEKYTKMAEEIEAGSEGVVYLPVSFRRTDTCDGFKGKGGLFWIKVTARQETFNSRYDGRNHL